MWVHKATSILVPLQDHRVSHRSRELRWSSTLRHAQARHHYSIAASAGDQGARDRPIGLGHAGITTADFATRAAVVYRSLRPRGTVAAFAEGARDRPIGLGHAGIATADAAFGAAASGCCKHTAAGLNSSLTL